MIRMIWTCSAAICLAAMLGSSAAGQSGSTSGMFGNRNLGGTLSGRSGSAFGTPGSRIEQQQSGAGEVSGNERFLRGNRQPGEFVGADTADMTSFFSTLSGGRGAGNLGPQNMNRRTTGGPNATSGTKGRQSGFRAVLRIGFDYPVPSADDLNTRVRERVQRVSQIHRLPALKVTIENGTATLSGEVASEYDRQLAGRLVLLEPGVRYVKNDLTVGPSSDRDEEPPETDSDSDPAPRSEQNRSPAVPPDPKP